MKDTTIKSLQGKDEMPTIRSGGKSSFTKKHAHDLIVIQKTGGYCTTFKDNEIGCLQSGGSNVMDKVPNVVIDKPIIVAQRGRYNENDTTEQKLETNNTDSTNTLTGVQKDNMLLLGGNIRRLTEIECERLQSFKDNHTKYGCYPIVKLKKKKGDDRKKISDQDLFNELSNDEKINHFKETKVKEIPLTQRYKMCGNAVTKDIVELIGKKLIKNF